MKKSLSMALVAVLCAVRLAAQEMAVETTVNPTKFCKKPFQLSTVTLTAPPPTAATPDPGDFPASCSAGWQPNFGVATGNHPFDKCFRHTFKWKAPKGCLCSSGTLTLQYQALYSGSQYADNDTVAIFKGGSVVPGSSQPLYTGGSVVGQSLTKSISLNCDWLANNSLSFLVQDDTAVTSATLTVRYCCPPCPAGQTEQTFPGTTTKYCCEGKPGDPRFCCSAEKAPGSSQD